MSLEGKELLVLGCGYLGLRVAEAALRRGMAVKAVSRNGHALAATEELGAATFAGQVEEEGWHRFAGADVNFALNCVSSAGGGLKGYRQSYLAGNHSVARWAKAVGFAGTALYTSSVSVYPDAEGEWVGEDSEAEPDNERGSIVRESEIVFLEGMKARAAVLRLAGLYGPGRHLLLDGLKEKPREIEGWGDYHLNLVRIEDVVSAVFACMEAGANLPSSIYNVVDDEPTRKEEIVKWLAERIGFPPPSFSNDPPTSGRCSRRSSGPSGRRADRRIANARLRNELGWMPVYSSFREGFADLMARHEQRPDGAGGLETGSAE